MPNLSQFKSKEEYNKWFREYRDKRKEYFREFQKEYNKKWREKNGYHNERKWKEKNPIKIKAQKLLQYNVRKGKIKKLPCLVCGNKKSQGHHDDYSKPLEVIWLCPLHHKEKHKKYKI